MKCLKPLIFIDYQHLKINPEENGTMMTMHLDASNETKEKASIIMFETFCTSHFYFSPPPLLSVYTSGRGSAYCLEMGDGVTYLLPCHQGTLVKEGAKKIDLWFRFN